MADTVALVSESGGSGPVQVLDLTSATVLASLSMATPGFIVVLPDATEAYITNGGAVSGEVYPIALPGYTAGTPISVDTEPNWLAVSPDGSHVYSASSSTNNVTPIATPSNVAGTVFALGGFPSTFAGGLAVNPSSTTLYATTGNFGIIPVAIPSNVVGTAFGATQLNSQQAQSMVIMPSGLTAYVGTGAGNGVFPVDLVAMTVGTPIAVPGAPQQIFLQPGGSQIFALDGSSNKVYVISTATNTLTHTISLTPYSHVPNSGGFDTAGDTFYFTDEVDGVILAINTSTYALSTVFTSVPGSFLAVIPVPPSPTPVTFDIPNLFIPRKPSPPGASFTDQDHLINYRTIERWAQSVQEILAGD
jgi:YVTN family beta-propeller protein